MNDLDKAVASGTNYGNGHFLDNGTTGVKDWKSPFKMAKFRKSALKFEPEEPPVDEDLRAIFGLAMH